MYYDNKYGTTLLLKETENVGSFNNRNDLLNILKDKLNKNKMIKG